jgi:signal transduction histidine kinase
MPPEAGPARAARHGYWRSLRFRILAIAITPALVGISLVTLYFSNRVLEDAEAALLAQGRNIARHLAEAADYEFRTDNIVALKRLLDYTLTRDELLALGVLQSDGQWYAVSGRALLLEPIRWRDGPREQRLEDRLLFVHPLGGVDTGPEAPVPSAYPPRAVSGSVVAMLDSRVLRDRRMEVLAGAGGLLTVFLAVVTVVAWRMSNSLSHRLHGVTRAVERIAGGELSVRVATSSPGELGILEGGINHMAAALEEGRANLEGRIREATAELTEQKQSAEEAVLAKSRFLAAASHDLRQPLHALSLLVAALRERATTAETLQLARHIEASAFAMQELLNALLDLSRLDAGVVRTHLECFPVNRLLQGIQRQFAPIAADKGLVLQVRNSPYWAYSDPILVERILMNFVTNAIRYTDAGWVAIGVRPENESLRLEVWDTGQGIPKAYQERIFEEYFQVDNPERARDKGLGLGLAIVARLARLLGTSVNVYSQPGKGSCFSFRLPQCAPAQDSDLAPPPGAPSGVNLEHALVAFIDDDQAILEAMVELLANWGIEVAAGQDVVQVLGDLHELGRPPDLIVSDYRLGGGGTGMDAIAALREAFGAELPAILITGDTAPETIQAITASGLPVLHKPIKPAKLRAMLAHVLGDRRAGGAG